MKFIRDNDKNVIEAIDYQYKSRLKETDKVKPEDILGSITGFLSGDASSFSNGKAMPSELSVPVMLPTSIQSFLNNQGNQNPESGRPLASLNWILLDEQFKYVTGGSGFIRVSNNLDGLSTIANLGLPMIKSGYIYLFK